MNALSFWSLRVVLVTVFVGTIGTQVWFIPTLARELAHRYPEFAYAAAPYTVWCVAMLVCAQAVLLALWVLVSKVRRGSIFSTSSIGWVNAIIVACVAATAMVVALEVALFAGAPGAPALVLTLAGATVIGLAVVLLTFVMRGLLSKAVALEGELEAVV